MMARSRFGTSACAVLLVFTGTVHADLQFRFDPETSDAWVPTSEQSVTLQIRSDGGDFQLGGFQVDFFYDPTAAGATLTGIDTSDITAEQMSTDFTDATDDGAASIFRAIAVSGGDEGVPIDETWTALARIGFVVGTAPEYPIDVEVTLYATLDMDFLPVATEWVTDLEFDGGRYRGPCDDCEIEGICYADGERNPDNDCQVCDAAVNVFAWTTLPDGTTCDDGQFCTSADACAAGSCAGEARDCADGVACTVDGCDEATDDCTHIPDDAACDNGAYCDGAEICDLVGGCEAGAPIQCADEVDCTIDACDENSDTCTHVPDDSACDNGTWCDGAETCDGSLGCLPGVPVDCPDDGLFCTGTEFCDEALDTCASAGDPCDSSETCNEQFDRCDPMTDDDDDDGTDDGDADDDTDDDSGAGDETGDDDGDGNCG